MIQKVSYIKQKEQIISFKVDKDLADAISQINNRSSFIRNAIIHALQIQCPLCKGLGVLDAKAQAHWQAFSEAHQVLECEECHSRHIVCEHGGDVHGQAKV